MNQPPNFGQPPFGAPMPQFPVAPQRAPIPHLSPAMAQTLATLLQQSRTRTQHYMSQISSRGAGLSQLAQHAQMHGQMLMQQGQQGPLGNLSVVMRGITQAANTMPDIEALIARERFLQGEIERILNGLPPTQVAPTGQQVQAPQFPQGQQPAPAVGAQPVQPAQPQAAVPIAQLQGQALLQAVQGAERMPTMQAAGGAAPNQVPVIVQQGPTLPTVDQVPPGTVAVTQFPTAPNGAAPTPAPAPASTAPVNANPTAS